MNELTLSTLSASEIRAHAERDYPEECCGFLIGTVDASTQRRAVHRVLAAENRAAAHRGRRFAIEPQDLADLEERLEPEELTVLGFYHSHPDHPAEPSQFDTEHAWPWYAYLIVRVTQGGAAEMGTFLLDTEHREYRRIRTDTVDATAAAPASPLSSTSAASGGS